MKGIVAMAEEQKDEPVIIQEMLTEAEKRSGGEILSEAEKRSGREILSEAEQKTKSSGDSVFTGLYDQLPDISVKSVDRFILICAIALVAVILVGVLKANHVF